MYRGDHGPGGGRLTVDLLRQNALLRGLTGPDAEAAAEAGQIIDLRTRQEIYDADAEIREALFPIHAVLSVVAQLRNGQMIEVGTIGREGVSGIPLLLGSTTSANQCYCQVPGLAISLPAAFFTHLQERNLAFRRLLDQYLQAYINLLGQLAACNRLHSVYERCARWLLLTHDRVKADVLPLTHEFLGMMLGTRRSGVTIAAATLKAAGFIEYSQGLITIVNRPGLEDASCECYAVARGQFGDLLR
ncbi:MAG TPA: Crp/Fnr family transcriptional regulator [Candidatus Dormibacteraeota bacterium]|nr:Crp/Fnr family transcriptional regulator [Candidatus Dormibacteraeota bacterium]